MRHKSFHLLMIVFITVMHAGCADKAGTETGETALKQRQVTTGGVQVAIGSNVRVSALDGIPHVETMVAANPRDPSNLVVSANVFFRTREDPAAPKGDHPNWRAGTMAFATKDGGLTWTGTRMPPVEGGFERTNVNAQVAFGPDGTAYYTAIERTKKIPLWASTDGGLSWQLRSAFGRWGDHPSMHIDHSDTRFAGRIYLTVNDGNGFRFFYSSDDGHHFSAPYVHEAPANAMTDAIVTLPDGKLMIFYWRYPGTRNSAGRYDYGYWCLVSSDGGETFAEPRHIAANVHDAYQLPPDGEVTPAGGFPGDFAARVDPRSGRVHVAWLDTLQNGWRIRHSYSDDAGMSWSEPKEISPQAPVESKQYQPVLAVNDEGVVGAYWLDTRFNPGRTAYDVLFAASVDGGETFTPPVRVSTQSSRPRFDNRQDGKVKARYRWLPGFDDVRFAFGGDYLGMAAAADGAFHLVWPDARHAGAQQLYASRIVVSADAK